MAFKDVVNDFRGRGIQIAFAMVGNRLDRTAASCRFWQSVVCPDRTFRKSGLTNSAGPQVQSEVELWKSARPDAL